MLGPKRLTTQHEQLEFPGFKFGLAPFVLCDYSWVSAMMCNSQYGIHWVAPRARPYFLVAL